MVARLVSQPRRRDSHTLIQCVARMYREGKATVAE